MIADEYHTHVDGGVLSVDAAVRNLFLYSFLTVLNSYVSVLKYNAAFVP